MRASSLVLAALASALAAITGSHAIAMAVPVVNVPIVVASTSSAATVATTSAPTTIANPARLEIPAINLNVSVEDVGVDSTGAMAVPTPQSGEVGWYQYGVVPGNPGSAVMDAHVFAAFSNLHKVAAGDDVYVVTQNGQTLHFVVTAVKDYALATLSPLQLFTPTSDRDLNLITCAGNLTPSHLTYDHRLIVYTTLVN